jgi:hypothetical protein
LSTGFFDLHQFFCGGNHDFNRLQAGFPTDSQGHFPCHHLAGRGQAGNKKGDRKDRPVEFIR